VVEGVETEEQLVIIQNDVGQCEVQGFLFSGALPPKEIATMLEVTGTETMAIASQRKKIA
jgi:EAL domain-containing protein (putative c-di-GMP-specific phosphodiesterase class I)